MSVCIYVCMYEYMYVCLCSTVFNDYILCMAAMSHYIHRLVDCFWQLWRRKSQKNEIYFQAYNHHRGLWIGRSLRKWHQGAIAGRNNRFVRLYVCMYVCMQLSVYVCTMYLYSYQFMCKYVYMYVCMQTLNVCMYVFMYLCMYVCKILSIYTYELYVCDKCTTFMYCRYRMYTQVFMYFIMFVLYVCMYLCMYV